MKSISPTLNLPQIDKEVLEFWSKHQTFKKSLENRRQAKPYLFYDGPPFSSGLPHYGHLMVGTMKDIIPRYQTMNGQYVERRFGWDTHGLPIEMIIEKELNLKGRSDILAYGVDKYNEACRSGVLSCVGEWQKITPRLGRWVDFENDYKTMDLPFMESVWWVFKQLWDKGRIYEGTRSMPYSWRLSTPLSNFEASSNYKDVQDPALTLNFKALNFDNTYFLAWTTTPWTLPANFALCLHPEYEYVQISSKEHNKNYILAKARLPIFFKDESQYEVLKSFTGAELKGQTYEPLLPYFADKKATAFRIVNDTYVSLDDGTGIVHTAPAHGEDDHRVGKLENLPIIDPTDAEGNFLGSVKDFAGRNIKEAEKDIIAKLKSEGKIFKHETITHSYPYCERSETPLMFKAISGWYVKVEDLRERMLKNNEQIHWVPEHIKHGRFGKWLENARDWNISRNRFWGNPLPIWRCSNAKCGHQECLGSIKELETKCGQPVKDLHKHFVDLYSWSCEKCGEKMQRVPEVLDCWFESGAMPYAQLHYPFENNQVFDKGFPADFIIESLDQTRGWFYTLMILGTSLFDKPPFKNCVVTGMILAEDGRKMSKRLKNYPDPNYIFDTYGADPMRLYMVSSPVIKGESLRFSETGVKEMIRGVFLPLWNAYSFFTTYANVDGFTPGQNLTSSENPLDRWIISRLQSVLLKIKKEMQLYQVYNVVPALLEFLEELTNWYVRRSRRRFWEDNKADKQNGYNTYYYVLLEFSKALAPFIPFVTENIYQNLRTLQPGLPESIHLCDYPQPNEKLIDANLEVEMQLIQKSVSLGRALRTRLNIRVRQPLASMTVVTKSTRAEAALKFYGDHIKEELNVKDIRFSADESALVNLEVKPDFPVLGPIFGKDMKELSAKLRALTAEQIISLEKGLDLEILGRTVPASAIKINRKAKDDKLEIETAEGVTVFFDTQLTEGLAREFVNRIQKMRKDANFHVSDRIKTTFKASGKISSAVTSNLEYIKGETLSLEIITAENLAGEHKETTDIEGERVEIAVSRI